MPDHRGHLGLTGLLFVSVGGILGSGWLFGPLYTAQLAGPASLIAWVIGGLAIMIIALTFAELGAMLPINGGITRYALGPLSVLALRQQLPDLERPFRLSWAEFVCPLAFVICGMVLYFTGWSIIWKLGLVFAVCGTLFITAQALRDERMDLLSAFWIILFLVGLVLITWLGGHGSGEKIRNWQGLIAVAVWSLICFFMARPLAIPPEQTKVYFDQIEAAHQADQQVLE